VAYYETHSIYGFKNDHIAIPKENSRAAIASVKYLDASRLPSSLQM
jgi:hypothetical protein